MRARSAALIIATSLALPQTGCSTYETQPIVELEPSGDAGPRGSGTPPMYSGMPVVEGTNRLVAWQLESLGTQPLVLGIYDAKEKVDCKFRLDERGQLRCLPWSTVNITETGWFTDPACTKRAYRADLSGASTASGFFFTLPLPRVNCEPKRYAVGELVNVSTDARYGGIPCAPLPMDPGSFGYQAVLSSEVEPPDRWASGTDVEGSPLFDRLRLHQIATEESTRFDDHFVDEKWAKPCDPLGTLCLPPRLDGKAVYSEDAACNGKIVALSPACNDAVFIDESYLGGPHTIGAEWKGPVFWNPHGRCLSRGPTSTPDGPDRFFEQGDPLNESAFAQVLYHTAGAGRLQLRGLPAGDKLVQASNELTELIHLDPFFDPALDANCNPVWAADGSVRCIPRDVLVYESSSEFFADDKCTVPAYLCGAGCDGRPAINMTTPGDRGQPRASEVKKLKAVTSAFNFPIHDGPCQPYPADAGPFFTLGESLPWDTFPQLTERWTTPP
jgi:hypothetical protein